MWKLYVSEEEKKKKALESMLEKLKKGSIQVKGNRKEKKQQKPYWGWKRRVRTVRTGYFVDWVELCTHTQGTGTRIERRKQLLMVSSSVTHTHLIPVSLLPLSFVSFLFSFFSLSSHTNEIPVQSASAGESVCAYVYIYMYKCVCLTKLFSLLPTYILCKLNDW